MRGTGHHSLISVGLLLALGGCDNYTDIPVGQVGLIKRSAAAFSGGGGLEDRILLPGRRNVGRHAQTYLYDITPRQVEITANVLMKDDINLSVTAFVLGPIGEKGVLPLVKKYGTSFAGLGFISRVLEVRTREIVSKFSSFEVKGQREVISDRIRESMDRWFAGLAPGLKGNIFLYQVGIKNVDDPASVQAAAIRRAMAQQERQRQRTTLEMTKLEARRITIEAEGISRSQAIINDTLSPAYLEYLAIQAQTLMASSENHETIYFPSGMLME